MQTRYLGESGLAVSQLAFGTMSFGNEADELESARLYARARRAGINLFDCADVYADGRAEQILGRLLRGERDQVVLTSKAGFPTGPDSNAGGASRYHLIRACEASLRRLGTDRIDVYFLHRHDPRTAPEEWLRALEQLVSDGKILYPAVSNLSAWQTQQALDLQRQSGFVRFACIQPMYNLLKRQAEVEILPMAAANRIGVLPYSPLAAGILSGKYLTPSAEARGRLDQSRAYQVRYAAPSTAEIARSFVELAARFAIAPAALAIAWVAAHPAVTAPLIGARNLEQLESSLAAADVTITPELYAELSALTPAPGPANDRYDDGSAHDPMRR